MTKNKTMLMLVLGLLGCVCFGAGDWLMMYGSVEHSGTFFCLRCKG